MVRLSLPTGLLVTLALLGIAADWPNLHGPNRDGHSTEVGFQWDWPKTGPAVAWKLDVGSGWAGVTASNGVAFLFHRVGDDEVLFALDPEKGTEKWKYAARTKYRDEFNFDDGPRCTPVIAGGRIFTLGANGDLHAIDEKKGTKLWHRNILTDYKVAKGFFGVGASPIVVGDKLLVNVGGKAAGIVAFDVETGKEKWKATDDAASYSSPIALTVGGKPRVAFLTRAGLVVLDPSDGTVTFTKEFRARLDASVNAASPVRHGEELFLTSSYGVGGVVLKPKGTEWDDVWANDKSLSCHYNTPVLVGDFLYGIDGRQEGGGARLRCVEWTTGDVKWSKEKFGCATLIAIDGGLLAATEAGELVRFDASSMEYKERARAKILDGVVRAAASLSDGKLYVRDEKKLVCVKLK